jgi:hypothetical protein
LSSPQEFYSVIVLTEQPDRMAQWIVVATLDRFGRPIGGAKPGLRLPQVPPFFLLYSGSGLFQSALTDCPSRKIVRFDYPGALQAGIFRFSRARRRAL